MKNSVLYLMDGAWDKSNPLHIPGKPMVREARFGLDHDDTKPALASDVIKDLEKAWEKAGNYPF